MAAMRHSAMNISRYQKLFGIGPLGMLISMILLGLLWAMDRALHQVEISSRPGTIRAIGSMLILLWICWHSWCVLTIRQWWRHDQLCTTGPFRFVRHPIYAGGISLASLGVALIFNSWIMLPFPLLVYATYSILVRKEESMMTEVFGEKYRRYAARTGRFLPRISTAKSKPGGQCE